MKTSDQIKYMVIGTTISLISFGIGSLVGGIDAQGDTTYFNSIVAREIVATDFIAVGEPGGSSVRLNTNEGGGTIHVPDKTGKNGIRLGTTGEGGIIIVESDEG